MKKNKKENNSEINNKWYARFLRWVFKPILNRHNLDDIKVESYDKSIIMMGLKNTKARCEESGVATVGRLAKKQFNYVLNCMGIVATGVAANKILAKALAAIAKMRFFV